MKLALTLALLGVLLGGAPALAEPPPVGDLAKDFAAANDRALEGDTKGAVGLYRSLVEAGVEHPEVFYNLGNALAAEGEEVEAIVAYERALRLDPGHEDAQANAATLRARLAKGAPASAAAEAGSVALAQVLTPIVASTPAAVVAWATVFAQILLFGAWWLARRAQHAASRRRWLALAIFGAACTLVFGALTASHALVRSEPLAVAKQASDLRQGPDARFDTSAPVSPGARLLVQQRDGRWLQVLQSDGTSGWIEADAVTRL